MTFIGKLLSFSQIESENNRSSFKIENRSLL